MSTIETFYLWISVVCLLAFITGFFFGVGATLSILRRWRRQWQADREQPTMTFTRPADHPELAVVSTESDDSFERPPA